MLSTLELLHGSDVTIDGICKLRQYKIKDIESFDGLSAYNHAMRMIGLGVADIMEILGIDVEIYAKMSKEERSEFSYFNFIKAVPEIKEEVLNALSFFIVEKVEYDDARQCFVVARNDGSEAYIDESNVDDVRNAILQINYAKESAPPTRFKSEKAKLIYMRCQKGKAKLEAAKKRDGGISLEAVVSSVAAKSNSYNLFNIFDLTIYQLYDQFAQINKHNQIDIVARRWAAWGEDDFDYSLWYKI